MPLGITSTTELWQPIKTVPHDRYVLLFDPERPRWAGNMEVGSWWGEENSGCFWSTGGPNGGLELDGANPDGSPESFRFTHWRDLPDDPTLEHPQCL